VNCWVFESRERKKKGRNGGSDWRKQPGCIRNGGAAGPTNDSKIKKKSNRRKYGQRKRPVL